MKHRKILSALLALVMVMALAVPAFAATVESTAWGSETLQLELDRDPLAVELPWNAWNGDLPVIYVAPGTRIVGASRSSELVNVSAEDNANTIKGLYVWAYARTGGPWIDSEEAPDELLNALGGMFEMEEDWGPIASSAPLTQEGTYDIRYEASSYEAYICVVAPGSAYNKTVLAEPNGLDAKLNAYKITAESTVSYNGQEIPLYTMLPGEEENPNFWIKHTDGAEHVINAYNAKVSNGTLVEIEYNTNWEFTGEEGYYNWLAIGDELENVLVYDFIENGVTIQSVAVKREGAASAEPEQPAQPAAPAAGTYIVKQWDTWGQLALNNYGTYAVWPALMRANGNKPLSVGMTVTLPEKLGSYARLAPQVLAEGEKFYTVKAGDTLGQIAVSEYGSFMMYKDIFQRNSDRLKNANSIYEGQILVLPAKK